MKMRAKPCGACFAVQSDESAADCAETVVPELNSPTSSNKTAIDFMAIF
jgi:hypothetical protein